MDGAIVELMVKNMWELKPESQDKQKKKKKRIYAKVTKRNRQ